MLNDLRIEFATVGDLCEATLDLAESLPNDGGPVARYLYMAHQALLDAESELRWQLSEEEDRLVRGMMPALARKRTGVPA